MRKESGMQVIKIHMNRKYWDLLWVIPGIVIMHELSHIIVGKGLNLNYGWYGLHLQGDASQAIYGVIGVYVNEITPWMVTAGIIGSLIFLYTVRNLISRQTLCVCLLYAFWIAKWDFKWLLGL